MLTISPAKANRLFWLGRYSERIFAQLHFLRMYYDRCLDEDSQDALEEFCRRLDLGACPHDPDLFLLQYLFGDFPGSLRHGLNCMYDNSIVLREELTTASVCYVNMCAATLNRCDVAKDINITHLQPITDCLLSFWGSVFQHVTNRATLNMLFIGRHVEYLDIYARFGYPQKRLAAEWSNLEHRLSQVEDVADAEKRKHLAYLFSEGIYGRDLYADLNTVNTLIHI